MTRTVHFSGAFMQSFTSVGPMLDVAALFSAIAVYSGRYLGIVMLAAFGITFTTIYVVSSLASRYENNGGYFFFAGKVHGKFSGVSVAVIYLLYSVLVIPNISIFVSFFSLAFIDMPVSTIPYWLYLFPIVFILIITGIISFGLTHSIRYTVAAGTVELLFMVVLNFLFLIHTHGHVIIAVPSSMGDLGSVFTGVIFGVLAFAGSGSSIFISENTVNGHRTVPKGISFAFVVTGIILVSTAFIMFSFLGPTGFSTYTENPSYVGSAIHVAFGSVVYYAYGAVAILSAINLSVAYGNALFSAVRKMIADHIVPLSQYSKTTKTLSFIALEIAIAEISVVFLGSLYAFLLLAGIVSLAYMVVHVIAASTLIRLKSGKKEITKLILAAVSATVLIITFSFSIFYDLTGGFIDTLTATAFLVIVFISFATVLLLRNNRTNWYRKITFDENSTT